MAIESYRADHVYFSRLEGTAGTPSTTNFFEGHGKFIMPDSNYKFESNAGKTGTGEAGTKQVLQATSTPWSYETETFSEICYLLAYTMGRSYSVISTTVERHDIRHLQVNDLTLPTFTIEYGKSGSNYVLGGCTINELTLNFQVGGNGIAKCNVSGFSSKYRKVDNAFALNASGSISSGVTDLTSEPLLNYQCLKVYLGSGVDALTDASSPDYTGENLTGTPTELTSTALVSSVSFTINNGMNEDDQIRAGGCGVRNYFKRGNRNITMEMAIHKDDSVFDTDAALIANTQYAVELLWNGPLIDSTNPYSLDMIFYNVQLNQAQQDDGTPISKTIPFSVFEDSNGTSLRCFAQSEVSTQYNG